MPISFLTDPRCRRIGSLEDPAEPVDEQGGLEGHDAEYQHRGRKSRPSVDDPAQQQVTPRRRSPPAAPAVTASSATNTTIISMFCPSASTPAGRPDPSRTQAG